MNNVQYNDLVKVYALGLLHDLYRPAQGKGGKEDHHAKSKELGIALLSQVGLNEWSRELRDGESETDDLIVQGQGSMAEKVLSLADKAEMSYRRGMAYVWASNVSLGRPYYDSFFKVWRDFELYQVRALKVLSVLAGMPGVELAVMAYAETNIRLAKMVMNEADGKGDFWKDLDYQAKLEAKAERIYLGENKLVRTITVNFSSLMN
jgi:hypothetical protein